jgi:outer membrane protein OmpA-like peptidoglycan-associated protein
MNILHGYSQTIGSTDMYPAFASNISYPAMSHDGKQVVFVSENIKDKIFTVYSALNKNGKWSEPKPFETLNEFKQMQSATAIGGFFFNYTGSALYFHAVIANNSDIYVSRFKEGKWNTPEKLETPINTAQNEYSPTLSTDEKKIFFLRDKPGTDKDESCKEIVYYKKNVNSAWAGPEFIPTIINKGCQETPFLCADNHTLLFASQRSDTSSLGKNVEDWGYNMYYTYNFLGNNWLNPIFIDEFSTEYNDISPNMDYTGNSFIFNIKHENQKKQPQKIFQATIPAKYKPQSIVLLSGVVSELSTKLPMDCKISIYNTITSVCEAEYKTGDSGKYTIVLQKGFDYKVDFHNDNYSHFYYYLNTNNLSENVIKTCNVELYKDVHLNLNVFDNELYYPLLSKLSITDSLTNSTEGILIKEEAKGRYSCKLLIGKKYKIHIETENFKDYDNYFDLRTDVQYNTFEQDIEMQAAKQAIILDLAGITDTSALKVEVKNLTRNEKTTIVPKRDRDGNLIVELREGDKYEIDVAKTGYTYFNTKVDVQKKNPVRKLDVKLDVISSATKMVFNDVTFETNSAEINPNSNEDLIRLVRFMTENPMIMAEISAHTDDIGSDAYNLNLSLKRAQSVVDFLISKGINVNRLKSKGYGESIPLVPNTSDENRAKNRRVEFKIIENTL